MANIYCADLNNLRSVSVIGLENLTEAYVSVVKSKYIYINNEGGQDDGRTMICPASNPASGRWICPQAPMIPTQVVPWTQVDKANSSIGDLETKSMSDILAGKIDPHTLPNKVPYFPTILPNLVLTTDSNGNYILSPITQDQIGGLISHGKIDWSGMLPSYFGAESLLYFDSNQFDRDPDNNVSIKLGSKTQPGVVYPGDGLNSDGFGKLFVNFGTGDNQALEGTTDMIGDVGGTHTSNIVDRLRNVPLTFHSNGLDPFNHYVLRLDSTNPEVPFFYLSPDGAGNVISGEGLPDIAGQNGALQTNGTTIFWGPVPAGSIQAAFAITGFNIAASTMEVGQTLSNPSFTASYNSAVSKVILNDNKGHSVQLVNNTSFTFAQSYTLTNIGSVSFTITATTTSDNSQRTASTSVSWLAKVFYGHIPTQTDNAILIDSMQSSALASGRGRSFTITAGTVDYIYYIFPSSFGTPTFTVGGFAGGFHLYASNVSVTNSYGVTLNYDIWQSDNIGLGNITVVVS